VQHAALSAPSDPSLLHVKQPPLDLQRPNNVSEIDIVYRKKVSCKISERPQIATSNDAYQVFLHYWDKDKIDLLEEFKVLYLNRSNRVLQLIPISQGGITGTVADASLGDPLTQRQSVGEPFRVPRPYDFSF